MENAVSASGDSRSDDAGYYGSALDHKPGDLPIEQATRFEPHPLAPTSVV
jgi:hypothetical protein